MTPDRHIKPAERTWATRDVAARLGVSEATVKRWADDGVIPCHKTPGGHRKFRVADIARFAKGQGITIEAPSTRTRYADVLALMLQSDRDELFAVLRQELDEGEPLERLLDVQVAQALVEIGERWSCDELTVAEEHLATATVSDVLARLLPEIATQGTRGLAIAACLAGERHELGSRMAALVAASRGYRILNTGADTPVAALQSLVESKRASLLMISASACAGDPSTLAAAVQALALAAGRVGARVFVGGTGFTDRVPLPENVKRAGNMRALATMIG